MLLKKYNLKKIFSPILLVFISVNIFGQITIKGTIKDTKNTSLLGVNVLVKKDSLNILDYTFSNKEGSYFFDIHHHEKLFLEFSALGFKTERFLIHLEKECKEIIKNVTLKEQSFELDEIIVQSEKTIKVKKDTVEINVNKFLTSNDATVEDLLKKIPGVSIDSQGTIKIGNQEIEKLMVDGDDFFEKGYKILSKNMPPDQLKKIQILQKYSTNRLLKGIEESDKVALNLVLKDDAKRQWFGNASLSYDVLSTNKYHLKSYAMNFGKKNKYILLSNFNSVGYDATGDINHLIKPIRFDEPASIGDDQQVYSLLNLSSYVPNFKSNRTNFNNTELASLNAIFNPTEKFKIKTLGFFNWDETDFYRNSINVVAVNDTKFTNTENYQLKNKKQIAFAKLDFIYTFSDTKTLEATTKYNNGNFNDIAHLIFNGDATVENLQQQNTLFDQKISYTNKYTDKKVFLLTGRYIEDKTPQNYHLNPFFYQDLFLNNNANNVKQLSKNEMQFVGINAHLLDRKQNDNLLELQIGNELRNDKLQTTFSLLKGNDVLEHPNDYQNQTNYQVNNIYFKSKYLFKINDLKITGNIEAHQLFNFLKNHENSQKQHPFFINPSIGFNWDLNKTNKFATSYSYNTTNAEVLDVFNDFVLTGFRSFSKSTGNFNQLEASSLFFNYQLGNWSDRFFANTFVMYGKNNDFFSSNSTLNQNYTQSEKIVIKDREFLSINSKLDYYFKFILSNLKLDVGYTKSQFKNIVNNSDLRQITANNYSYGFELRSGFSGFFNYHLGTKWNATEITTTIKNKFTDTISFLDFSFIFTDTFDVQLQSESYYFANLATDNVYHFLDFDTSYKLIKNKLTLGITGKNLLNTEKFRNFSISDIGNSTTEYRLLPRFILLKMEYRF
ncbi:MAG: carboxypeptidase-like regulatory domain-containing protein [Polaribacter sp.]|nr:carboxypeptidase-like regulatory domain-containing protein [Polaribacter sp.]